jgi:hypothetical protein
MGFTLLFIKKMDREKLINEILNEIDRLKKLVELTGNFKQWGLMNLAIAKHYETLEKLIK